MAEIQRGHHFMGGFGNQDYLEDYFTNREFQGKPAANFSENEKRYKIEVGMPGLCRDDVNIEVAGNELIVSGDRGGTPDAEEKEPYSRQEFSSRHFRRSFKIPEDSATDRISARCEEGLLVIEIPRREISSKRTIKIK